MISYMGKEKYEYISDRCEWVCGTLDRQRPEKKILYDWKWYEKDSNL